MSNFIKLFSSFIVLTGFIFLVSCSGGSNSSLPPLPLNAVPVNVQATVVNDDANITWDTVSNETYNLYVSSDNGLT